jgi:predicted nucleic acid-binding protein
MLFDTDVLVWALRGNGKAAATMEECDRRDISVVTYMELIQGARNRREIRTVKGFLADWGFQVLPLTENIGHRAAIYMEEYRLKAAICMADALLAATAVEMELTFCTGNQKHYRLVGELDVRVFRP